MAQSVASSVWEFDDDILDGTQTAISDEEIKIFRDITFKMRHPDGKRDIPWPNDCVPKEEVFGNDLAIQSIYEWESGNTWSRCYQVEVKAFIALKYTINFDGTDNYDIQSAFTLKNNEIIIELQPYEKEIICMISTNKQRKSQFKVKGDWTKCDIDPTLFEQCIVISNNKIKDEYDKCLAGGLNENVAWDQMPSIIRDNNLLFVDGEMYPSNDALYVLGDNDPNAINVKNNNKYVMWRRVGDWIKGKWPNIFANGLIDNNSINPLIPRQGIADDSWLISVISVLSLRIDLISSLFLSKDGNNDPSTNSSDKMYGFYRMKICDNGVWEECILDDLFPCRPYWLPIMCNYKQNNQIWPNLIEKLCAKIRGGCYQCLNGGTPKDAFTDLTGCPVEEFDLRTCDTDTIFDTLNSSYNGDYNTLSVVICDEDDAFDGDLQNKIGLLSGNSYSVLAINMDYAVICLRDPFGRGHNIFTGEYNAGSNAWDDKNLLKELGGYDPNDNGIIYVTFNEFIEYFTTIFLCYVDKNYSEQYAARQTIDISYDKDAKKVSVPIIKLTVPNGGEVEYLGLSQKGLLTNSKEKQVRQLDLCLFVLKSATPNDNSSDIDLDNDIPAGYIPMSTARNKFVQFGASDDDVKSNDISSVSSWKNSDKLTEGTYYLIPWTSGTQWDDDIKSNDDDNKDNDNKDNDNNVNVRYVGLTVHGKTNDSFTLQPVNGYTGNEIDGILKLFTFKYGEKKQWQDLERRHFQCGQLDIYCGKNGANDKNITVKMTATEMTNVSNVSCYYDFKVGKEKTFSVEKEKSVIFGVQTTTDPDKPYSNAFKYSFTNEWL